MAKPEVELDLRIENGGHRVHVAGSGGQYVVECESLRAVVHFARLGRQFRGQIPQGWRIQIGWRGMRWG